MATIDTEHRALCHALFDAIEREDLEGMRALLRARHDAVVQRHRPGGDRARTPSPPRSAGRRIQRRRTYDDRIVNTFDDGFVVQYTLNVVLHDGRRARCRRARSPRCTTG